MYQSPRDHVMSRISPGTIIRIKAHLRGARQEWFYAIRLYDSFFYVITAGRVVALSHITLLRAYLDNRLEIIGQ